tara:strand:+ start:5144 stop:5611 length:468 start_codon:yes stop_codon:yes gene_type:complete
MKILFVCLGNICRSPLAEGIFKYLSKNKKNEADSCGTGNWHVGSLPDQRMRETAEKHNIKLESKARQIESGDFYKFDLIIAMDRENKNNLMNLARSDECKQKIRLMRDFENFSSGSTLNPDVPDPYYGGSDGFEHVFNLVYKCTKNLISNLEKKN